MLNVIQLGVIILSTGALQNDIIVDFLTSKFCIPGFLLNVILPSVFFLNVGAPQEEV
jgi:hypothetical protein